MAVVFAVRGAAHASRESLDFVKSWALQSLRDLSGFFSVTMALF